MEHAESSETRSPRNDALQPPKVPSGRVKDKTLFPAFAKARRCARLSLNIAVRVFDTDGFTNGRGHDVGTGGMAIYVPLNLAVGTAVNVSFQLPYSRMTFGVRAIIRNSNGFRYGVEFADLTPSEEAEIKRIISILELTA